MREIKKILFPTDFSDHSNHALPYSVGLASIFGAKLYVLHVITLFEHDPYDPKHTFPDISAYRNKLEEAARARLGEVADEAQARPGDFEVEKLVERGTAPYENILDVAEREEVDLIVLSTQGRSGLSRFLLGSVAEKVVRFAPCPVLVVKQREHEFIDPETGLIQLKRILAPIDFSDASKTAVCSAAALAERFGSTLYLAHVIELRLAPDVYTVWGTLTLDIKPDIREKIEQQLKDFAAGDIPAGVSTEFFVLEGKAHAQIDKFARDNVIDLIVMGTQGYDEIGDYLIGSTTERTVRHASCPVLVTH